ASAHPGGMHWIDLADARSIEDVCAALANALGEELLPAARGDELVQRIGYAIAARGEALFVLDDVEHLAEIAPGALDAWRADAAGAAFLMASRERLRVAGERCLVVGPLPVPDETEIAIERIASFDSVRLFVDRAAGVRPGYAPSADEALDIAAI